MPSMRVGVLPKNHRFVLEVLRESGLGRHRTVGEIFAESRRRRPGIGHTTIYRALDRLCEMDLVREVRVPGAAYSTYEPMGPPHAHFYCTGCGSIEDVDYRLPEGVLGSLAERHHVAITGETLTFDGRCKTCLEAPATI